MLYKLVIILLLLLVFILINILIVAFFTLLERVILASTQIRKGPNFVGILGLAQPIADAVKLLLKELVLPKKSNLLLFIIIPIFMLYCSLFIWVMLPLGNTSFILNNNLVFLYSFMFSSLNGICIVFVGWASNSKYAFQGAMRSISQIISYELPFNMVLLNIVLIYGTLNIIQIINLQYNSLGVWNFITLFLFLISSLGETNRTPFDLAEAESELVSGYNTEHGSVLFTLMFLGEYCYIVIICNLIVILFLGGWLPFSLIINIFPEWLNYAIKLFLCLYIYILIRATLPRFRYDQLMYLGWTVLLPMTISTLCIDLTFNMLFLQFPITSVSW